MAHKEYFVSRLSLNENNLIRDFFVYESDGIKLSEGQHQERPWLVNQLEQGVSVSTITKNEQGQWIRGNAFAITNGIIKYGVAIPKNLIKRKTFVSYYHNDDQLYKEKFHNLFSDLIVHKSVDSGDIDSDNSDEYIKQLIQKDYLKDTTVLVVLLGPKTKCRKHVDWEISGALSSKIGGTSGLIGILLPSHPDYGPNNKWNPDNLPKRLAANVSNGYGSIYDWTNDRIIMQDRIETAFASRLNDDKILRTSIPQMSRDLCN